MAAVLLVALNASAQLIASGAIQDTYFIATKIAELLVAIGLFKTSSMEPVIPALLTV